MTAESRTSHSLLAQMRDARNDAAWRRFLAGYGPRILAWCRRWGLAGADADEVAGMVLVKLVRRMRDFEYDPTSRFRAWLRTVVDSQVRDFLAERRRQPLAVGASGDSSWNRFGNVEDDAAPAAELEAELHTALMPEVEEAVAEVRGRVDTATWLAFWLTVGEGRKGADVAHELAMPVASVYQAKCRVARLLRNQVQRRLDPNG
jgi:RNA polymerase sigma-70 factor (ECF subfamily)